MAKRAGAAGGRRADLDLRGPSRLVAAAADGERGSPGTTPPSGWSPTSPTWASPISSCCRSPSIRSAAPGATSRSACSRRPRRFGSPDGLRRASSIACHARGHRRDPRLGAGAFPDRRARPGALRRHRALRASRSARGLPPRLEHLHLQFRPPRGAGLPDRQRAVLARALPCRRAAGRCGRLDALSRLQPPAGEWIPNVHGGRENLEAIDFLRHLNAVVAERCPGAIDDRRGIDRLARRHRAAVRRRPRLRLQMEHGLDARHAALHRARSDPSRLPPRRHDLRPALRLLRELHPAALATTRWCTARARCSARCRATAGRDSPTCAPISASCGRIPARSCCSWAARSPRSANGTTTASSTGTCSTIRRMPACSAWCAT